MNNRNWALLLLLASFWGASFMFTSIGLRSLDFLPMVTYRIALASLVLALIAFVQKWDIPRGKIWLHYWLVGSLMCSVPFSLIVWGQQFVPSGLAAILNAGTAIFGAALAPIFFADERMSWNKAVGVLIGFAGIVLAIGVENLSEMSLYNLGQWAVVLATLCYALGGVYGKKFLRQTRPRVNALGMVSTAALSMIFALIFLYDGNKLWPDANGVIAVAYLAIIGTAFAYLLYYFLLREVGVAYVTLVTLLVPVFAISLGAIFLGETLHSNEYLGFVLVAFGLIFIDGRIFSQRQTRLKTD